MTNETILKDALEYEGGQCGTSCGNYTAFLN